MEEKHQSLVRSMLHFLSLDQEARAWIIASFHNGRAKLAVFFDPAATAGLEAEEIWSVMPMATKKLGLEIQGKEERMSPKGLNGMSLPFLKEA